jgi:hypothetical protein
LPHSQHGSSSIAARASKRRWLKRHQLDHQFTPDVATPHSGVERLLDPKNLINSGKKVVV